MTAFGRKSAPSSAASWRLSGVFVHRDLYLAYPAAYAVLHTHSTWSTILACLEREIPPFHYMVAVAGGATIPCAPYAPFGTKELSDSLLGAIKDRRACLLAHQGLVCPLTDATENRLTAIWGTQPRSEEDRTLPDGGIECDPVETFITGVNGTIIRLTDQEGR